MNEEKARNMKIGRGKYSEWNNEMSTQLSRLNARYSIVQSADEFAVMFV
jgi:hypothetical protein